jgi:hypothetical protein
LHALEQLARGRGDRGAMRRMIARREHHAIAGRDQGNAEPARSRDAFGEAKTLARQAAEADPEPALRGASRPRRTEGIALSTRRRHARSQERGGEPRRLDDQVEPRRRRALVGGECRDEIEGGIEVPRGDERAQARIAAPIERDHQRLVGAGSERAAEERRQPLGPRGLIETDREVEVVTIGEREALVAKLERALDQRLG